jgi:broad specificity phosphatase PhoE
MAKKVFYMVRHGESIMNAKHIRQGEAGGLSEAGKHQAEITGERLKNYFFDVILASPFERTRETADIIYKHMKNPRPVEYTDLLKERRNPSEIIEKPADDREVKKIIEIIDKSYHSDDYRFSDEENFNDLKQRALKLLDYLSKRPEHLFLLVTHSIFLKMISAVVVHGESLTAEKYNLISFMNYSNNAAISVCEYNSGLFGLRKKPWRLLAWDDYAR